MYLPCMYSLFRVMGLLVPVVWSGFSRTLQTRASWMWDEKMVTQRLLGPEGRSTFPTSSWITSALKNLYSCCSSRLRESPKVGGTDLIESTTRRKCGQKCFIFRWVSVFRSLSIAPVWREMKCLIQRVNDYPTLADLLVSRNSSCQRSPGFDLCYFHENLRFVRLLGDILLTLKERN